MDKGFLDRVVRTALVTGLGLGVVVAYYFGIPAGSAFAGSAVWASVGLKLLQVFLVSASRPAGGSSMTTFFLGVLKFPVLYGIGIALLLVFKPNGLAVFAGLTLVPVVVVLKHVTPRSFGRSLVESPAFIQPEFSRPVAGESREP